MKHEDRHRLLERISAFYERAYGSNAEAAKHFKKMEDEGAGIPAGRVGFSDGTLLKSLPSKGKIIQDMQALGILDKTGKELFSECLIFPLMDDNSAITGMEGIRITDGAKITLPKGPNDTKDPTLQASPGCRSATHGGVPELNQNHGNGVFQGFEGLVKGPRTYRLMSVEKSSGKLKATVKFEKAGRFHLDTMNLYSAKERKTFAQEVCRIFSELPEVIEAEVNSLIAIAEAYKDSPAPSASPVMTDAERQESIAFGKSENMIERILSDYEKCGYVGDKENNNKLLSYLAATSRKMAEKSVLSVIILSSSGAGKSALQDTTLEFMPAEDVVKLTNLSGKALFYKERTSLRNKILALEESSATNEEANYAIRSLISSGRLSSEVTVRDSATGKMTTQLNVIDAGSTCVFLTTTDPELDQETASRFFCVGIDESPAQTTAIIEHQMRKHSMEGLQDNLEHGRAVALHRNFQRLLKPLKVVNRYRMKFSDTRLQARRLYPQILNLINAVAFLRQMGKEIKVHNGTEYIETDNADIETALNLARDILGKSVSGLSMPSQDLLRLLDGYVEEKRRTIGEATMSKGAVSFTRKEVRNKIGWTNTRLHLYMRELTEHEFVILESGRRNTLQHYRLLYDSHGRLSWLDNAVELISVEG
ncbi:MAG TPA: hypothetical protein DET40_02320 [Lentisphaeria bacterium]|nr:MAG: hypothetical protein A2X45_16920 [Lentisphaerae bacterium GWF2_50_93]HCE42367.1 hypothetical protein [Lentisphaeria bacterium]